MTNHPPKRLLSDSCDSIDTSNTQPSRKRDKIDQPSIVLAEGNQSVSLDATVGALAFTTEDSAQGPTSYLEDGLLELKTQWLEEYRQPVYIPPMAKASLHSREDEVFCLMDKVQEFLDSERQVMLLLGDSGAGKSTFNRFLEHHLWTTYTKGGSIPLYINLPTIDSPDQDMITKQLEMYDFTNDQIQKLKEHRRFVLICDGYDESQLTNNLYTTNEMNQPGGWNTKMIVCCRTQYLGPIYTHHFVPQPADRSQTARTDLFQEAVIAPFSQEQIRAYVACYVPLEPRSWVTEEYMDILAAIPYLMELVKNPFLLTLALEVLPTIVKGEQDLSTIKISRIQLYDTFVVHWLNVNKRRLESNTLSNEERSVFDLLLDAGFILMGINYSARLALAIFENQDGNPIVKYNHLSDKSSWKVAFFGLDTEVRLLRESSPVSRTGSLFMFIHRSMLEYFFSRSIFDPSSQKDNYEFAPHTDSDVSVIQPLDPNGPFFKRNLLKEPSIIQFLCERVKQSPGFEKQLNDIVHQSKIDAKITLAATNAITVLVQAGVSFNAVDLQGIRVPSADLSGGQFDCTQFQGADLRDVDLSRAWLRKADFTNAQMEGVRFGELPYLQTNTDIETCVYSPDGALLATVLYSGKVDLYDTKTWTVIRQTSPSKKDRIRCIAFSPDSQQFLTGSENGEVRLWDTETGKALLLLDGHMGDEVTTVLFLPCGKRVASGGYDNTVQVWCLESKQSVYVFQGHTDYITRIALSSEGKQLVSGGWDGTIRFWDLATGKPGAMWDFNFGPIWSLAYSPDGRWVATGHTLGEVRLWCTVSGEPISVLRGHTGAACGLSFSPNGLFLASSGDDHDKTVRLWNVSSFSLISVLSGHSSEVKDVTFSPDGSQIVSGGGEGVVRLWEMSSTGAIIEPKSTLANVTTVCYSTDGRDVISASKDGYIRRFHALTGEELEKVTLDSMTRGWSCMDIMAFSPDRNQVVVQEDELTLQMWEYQTATQGRVLEGHSNVVASVAYSSCGRWVISASRDMTVRLWDLEDAEQDHVFGGSWDSDEGVRCLAFSSTGPQFATGDMGGRVCLYDARTRSCSRTLRLRDEILPRSLAYSPDDKQLAIGTASGSVYLWDLCSTDPGIELCGHRSNVQSISYSPCGQWLTTGSRDETVRLWRFQGPGQKGTLSCVSVISGFLGTVRSIVWSPVEPLEFVTGSKDCSVRLWRISTSPTPPTTKAKGDRGCFSVQQLWGSNLGTLCAMDLKFEGAIGLSMMNQRLLVQRSSVPDSWESDGYAASDDEFGWYDEDQWTETGSEDGGGSIAGGEKSEVVEELSEFEWGEDGSEDEWVHDSSDE